MKTRKLSNGQTLGPYTVTDYLGGGGMGEVYLAHDSNLDRSIALKILTADDASSSERFLLEGKALAKFAHRNVVSVYGVGQIDGISYIAMEFVPGHALDWALKRGKLSLADQITIFRQICEGIAESHRHLIIHRDLKPANVLISNNGEAKLVDFGIAKLISADNHNRTTVGVVMGTMNYLAPEIARGQRPTLQTDVYGLGAILYEMLVGRPPFQSENTLEALEKIKSEPVVFPTEIQSLIPEELTQLVLRMLAKDLNTRYATVADVLADLKKVNLDELPAELRNSRASTAEIQNEKEVRSILLGYGYQPKEVSLIFGIACEIEERETTVATAPVDPDKTIELSLEPTALILKPETIERARARYDQIKSQIITGRRTKLSSVDTPRTPQSKFNSKFIFAGASALALAAVVGVSVTMTTKQSEVENPSLSLAPARKPAQTLQPPSVVAKTTPNPTTKTLPTRAESSATSLEDERAQAEIDEQMKQRLKRLKNVAIQHSNLQPGDEWIYTNYDATDLSPVVYTFKSVKNGKLEFELNSELKREGFYGVKGLEALFPLRLGNQISVDFDGHPGTCQSFATGSEKTQFKTPAGSFEIATIVCKSEDGFATDTLYYSEAAGRPVFHTSKRGDWSQTLMLKSYRINRPN